jgi:hypothetical protein
MTHVGRPNRAARPPAGHRAGEASNCHMAVCVHGEPFLV